MLSLEDGFLQATLSGNGATIVQVGGLTPEDTLYWLNPENLTAYLFPSTGTSVSFTDTLSSGTLRYAFSHAQSPARIVRDTPSDLANPSNEADYLIITTPALYASAQALATYHEQTKGFKTHIAFVEDIFDQFDYGRPTPLAIRRMVHLSQQWRQPPRFLMLWGDALDPDRRQPLAPWQVPTMGTTTVSDGWFGAFYRQATHL